MSTVSILSIRGELSPPSPGRLAFYHHTIHVSHSFVYQQDLEQTSFSGFVMIWQNVFPENIAQATIASYRTKLSYDEKDPTHIKGQLETYKINSDYPSGSNVLGLVCFSVVLGITLGKMGEKGRPLQNFFHSFSEAMMIITGWVIWLSPLGVFFLVTAKIMEIDSFSELVGRLGLYFMTVLLGLFLHGFGTLSILFILATRKLPCRYIAKMGQVMATAFGTASSSATMPITIGCCDEMGLDPRITRFVIPIGATINMDGTALYEAVAAIFIAQLRKVEMSFGKIVAVRFWNWVKAAKDKNVLPASINNTNDKTDIANLFEKHFRVELLDVGENGEQPPYTRYIPTHCYQGHKRGGLTTAPLLWQCELTFRRLRSSTLQLLFARLAKHFKNVGVKT
ncbi:hypothetical protein evm_014123 [Chilo suppressalis]|nr:hypothetical protein evm_014123 [Chilo suppressalis]